MQDSNQSDLYSTEQNIETSENSKSNIRFEYNTHGIKDQIKLNEDQFIGFLNEILTEHKKGEISEQTKNKMKDVFPFLENRVPMFMDVNIFLPEKNEIENLEEKRDLLSFQEKKDFGELNKERDFGKKIDDMENSKVEPVCEKVEGIKKMVILKPIIGGERNGGRFDQFNRERAKVLEIVNEKKSFNIPKKNSFNIFSEKVQEKKNITKKIFIPNINKKNSYTDNNKKIIKEKNLYSFNDYSNKSIINFKDYKKDNNNEFSLKTQNKDSIYKNYEQEEDIARDKMNISSTLKKLKYYWRGTNQNYPYTFKKVKKCGNQGLSNYYFLECIDISQKIINKKDFENDFRF